MPEPVSTISALLALTQSLASSHQDKKFAADVRAIQELVARFQSDYFRMEKEKLELHTEIAELKRLVSPLQARLSEFEKENSEMKDEIIHLKEKLPKVVGGRPDIEEKILLLLWGKKGLSSQDIGRAMSIDSELAKHHLSELSEAELVYYQGMINREGYWVLRSEGRAYMVKNGLNPK